MKTFLTIPIALVLAAAAALAVIGCSTTYTQPAMSLSYDEPPSAYQYEEPYTDEYYELSSYGVWTTIDPFGRVWRPTVVSGWRPYVNGHWLWSNWGWTWVSYEPFGWVVYHYGYWLYDPIWGWMWFPGDKWFSARVKWMVYDDYICWAPMPPPGYNIGDPWHTDVPFIWDAVRADHFTSSNVRNFTIRPPRPTTPIPKDDYRYRTEPKLTFIERYTKKTIKPAHIDVRKVEVGSQTYRKMELPAEEKRKVDHYRPRIEKKVIPPETRTQQPARGKQSGESTEKRSSGSKQDTKKRTKKQHQRD